ncbi:MAG: DUF4230 domain-containing protein [Bacteroidaceae bacterium]|nr:DUF4230 domain-containing protein [Bacteroidaceae bacterium]
MKPDKSNHLLSNALLITTAVVVCALFVRKCHEDREIFDVEVVDDKAIDITPAQIRSIERIGEWEFLSIADEEMIDTVRHRTLGRDDRLVRIYRGTLRLGVDLSKCEEGWVQTHGDTITVDLPPVGLLSERFIDEARTRAFYESGTWDARAKEQMYRKAARQMRRRCLTPANIEQARENGREQMTALFRTFGFTTVEVRFK